VPVFDRFWWLKGFYGLIHLGLGIVLLAWVASTSAAGPDDPANSTVSLCGGIALLAVFIGIGLVVSATRGHSRKRARLAAIGGNSDAVPLARIRMPAGPIVDVATQPLVLVWRAKIIVHVGALIAVTVAAIGLVTLLVREGDFILDLLRGLAAAGIATLLTFAVPALLVADVGAWQWSQALRPILFGGRIQTIASEEGVRYTEPLRRHQFVAWSDARLLEVRQGGGSSSLWGSGRHFILYGTSGFVEWHDKAGSSKYLMPASVTPEEQSERAQALLRLVQARTGLVPRTFDLSLRPPPLLASTSAQPASPGGRQRRTDRLARVGWRIVFVAVLGGFAAGLLAGAVAVALVPLTTSPVLNLLVAAAIGLPTIVGMVVIMVKLLRSDAPLLTAVTEGASPALSSIQVEPDVVYAYTMASAGMTLRSRLLAAGFGVLCMILLLPAVIGILMLVHGPLPGGVRLAGIGDFQVVVATLLAIPGIAGPPLLLSSILPHRGTHRRTIRAGPDALEADGMRIPWDRVESVDVLGIGQDISYVVTATSPSSPIIWSSQSLAGAVAARGPDAQSVTADQLAEIVAQRSSVPLTVRWMI